MFDKIKYFIQRGQRGWSDEDLWDFDDYLSDVIISALKELKKIQTGCPSELYDKDKKNNECHQWKEILEEIIQGFESCKELKRLTLHSVKKNNGKGDYYDKEFDEEKSILLTKKFERGMQLFSKYFMNFWD